MHISKTTGLSLLVAAAVTGAVAAAPSTALAAGSEKCYGVSKAGKNDCATATSSCAGTAKMDKDPTAFIVVPKGTCDKISGGKVS